MLTVSQVAKLADISEHTIRYYIKLGLLHPRRHADNNYQLFSHEDVQLLDFIKNSKLLGFTLKEIAEFCKDAKQGQSPCPKVRAILKERIKENRKKIQMLQKLDKIMKDAYASWSSMEDQVSTGRNICQLIESFGSKQHS